MIDGHSGLGNEKREEDASGDFQTALSYLKINERTAHFVIHAYSNSFDVSPLLQRSDVQPNRRQNFLERLGFQKCEHCNILTGKKCYFKVIEEVNRNGNHLSNGFESLRRSQAIHERYRHFANNLQALFDKMHETDKVLYGCGFELPWTDLKLSPILNSADEKAYAPGFQYDFYQDLREITKSTSHEMLVIEPYPSDELINLYLDKINPTVRVKVLIGAPKSQSQNTKQQRDNFLKVAQKYAQKPGVNFELRENPDTHDRLFFVDGICWISGQSVKDAATQKPTYLLKVESSYLFRQIFTPLWENGQKLNPKN